MIFDTLMQETVEFLNSKNSEEPKEEEIREMKSEDFDWVVFNSDLILILWLIELEL